MCIDKRGSPPLKSRRLFASNGNGMATQHSACDIQNYSVGDAVVQAVRTVVNTK
jgi:hypothetical protein